MVCARPRLIFFLFVCLLKSETKGFSFTHIVTQIIILPCIVFCPQMKHLGLGVWLSAKTHTYCFQGSRFNCQHHKNK